MEGESIHASLPNDIAVKIASLLQVLDLCALGSCSRFWRELSAADCLWESLARKRWPLLPLLHSSSSSSSSAAAAAPAVYDIFISKEWRSFYIMRHYEMAERTSDVIRFVEQCSSSTSIEVGDYLKAIGDLSKMQLGYDDVQMFLFKPSLHNVLLNLVGLHYCVNCLRIPAEVVLEALKTHKISERHVCVKWWKVGRWFHGFRMRDESHSRWLSLADLALDKEEVLPVLRRGAVHEVLRVQISIANPTSNSWSFQIIQREGQHT